MNALRRSFQFAGYGVVPRPTVEAGTEPASVDGIIPDERVNNIVAAGGTRRERAIIIIHVVLLLLFLVLV